MDMDPYGLVWSLWACVALASFKVSSGLVSRFTSLGFLWVVGLGFHFFFGFLVVRFLRFHACSLYMVSRVSLLYGLFGYGGFHPFMAVFFFRVCWGGLKGVGV